MKSFFKPRPQANIRGADGELLIYEEIGIFGITARDVVRELQGMTAGTIYVRINSPGGDVFDGLAIANALRSYKGRKVVKVEGLAASIASIIALAGDEVEIAPNAFIMIHNAWGITMGDARDHQKMAANLEKISGSLVETYRARTGKSVAQVKAWMDAETWFTADEAKAARLADRVIDLGPAAKVQHDLSGFKNTPRALAEAVAAEKRRLEEVWREAGASRRAARQGAAAGAQPDQKTADAAWKAALADLKKELAI